MLLFLDEHVYGGVTVGQKWRGANNIVGAWGHMPLAWLNLKGRIVGVGAMDVLRYFCHLAGWKMNISTSPSGYSCDCRCSNANAKRFASA